MIRTRRLLVIAASLALMTLGLPALPAAAQAEWFQVQPRQGIFGFGWFGATSVQVSWDLPTPTSFPVGVEDGHWSWQPEDWSTSPFPAAGAHVVVSDGTTSTALDVSSVWVTSADAVTDVVSGIADPGDEVWLTVYGEWPPITTPALTGDDGGWSVDVGALGIDLTTWVSGGSAEVRQGANATAYGWAAPTPFIRALVPDPGSVYGHDWLPGSTVSLAVDQPDVVGAPDDLSTEVTADNQGTFVAEMAEGYRLDGAVVTATSEDGLIQRVVTVTDFDIDSVTLPDTVRGHAPAGTQVKVFVGPDEGLATFDTPTTWHFVTTEDLVTQGDGISARITDTDSTPGDWIETSFYVRDHLEVSPPGPMTGQVVYAIGDEVTYGGDLWVGYRAPTEAFTVTWDWGDGTTGTGSVSTTEDADILSYSGTHTYAKAGLFLPAVTISQPGLPAATSTDSDWGFAVVYDPRRPASIRGTATVAAEDHAGGYYDLDFAGGPVNLTVNVKRAARTTATTGSVTVQVPGMNSGAGMTFTATQFEKLGVTSSRSTGTEVVLIAHGTVTNGENPDSAASAMIHFVDRTKGADLLRIVVWDDAGAGYRILDTVTFDSSDPEQPWTSPPMHQVSAEDDQVTSSSLKAG